MILYRLLISVFVLWQAGRLLLNGQVAALRARFGPRRSARPGPHLWLHAASNGELASARPVIKALQSARPDLGLLVTCNSESGVDLAQSWGLEARLAPFDLSWVVARVMRDWHVVGHLTLESEIWPHRVRLCPGPVIVLGARMSANSARGWTRFGAAGRQVLGQLGFVVAQDGASRERLLALGVPPGAMGPVFDLKALYRKPDDQRPDAALRAAFVRHETWLAASTHEGDEAVVLEAHRLAREDWQELKLILAPRHPRRSDEIQGWMDAAGMNYAVRSKDAGQAGILLADTLGEMALWYELAGIVFIGGTLSDRGGHTPYEPAAFGAALIHGPDVANFRKVFARLDGSGAADCVTDATTLARAILALRDPEHQKKQGLAAQKALAQAVDFDALMRQVLDRLKNV